MTRFRSGRCAATAVFILACGVTAALQSPPLQYPATRRGDVVAEYHGTRIARSVPVDGRPRLERRRRLGRGAERGDLRLSAAAADARDAAEADHRAVGLPEDGLPVLEGGRLFYRKNRGLQKQAPLYMRAGLTAAPTLLIDPNTWSPDGSRLAGGICAPSPDGELLAYGVSEGGADWRTVRVATSRRGKDLADEVQVDAVLGHVLDEGRQGVLLLALSRAAARTRRCRRRSRDRRSTTTASARRSRRTPDLRAQGPADMVHRRHRHRGRPLPAHRDRRGIGNNNRLYYADLGDPTAAERVAPPIKPLVEEDGAEYRADSATRAPLLFVRTDRDAPNRKVIAIDLQRPAAVGVEDARARTARKRSRRRVHRRPHRRRIPRRRAEPAGMFDLGGGAPASCRCPARSLAGLSGRQDSPTIFYAFTSPLYPATVFALRPASGHRARRSRRRSRRSTRAGTRRERSFATSKDGTRVPMFVTRRKGLPRDGSNPTMLYGYGGFSISDAADVPADVPAWLERGGIWVTANMRGGGEYGEAWHKAGMFEQEAERVRRLHRRRRVPGARRSTRRRRSSASWADRTAVCSSAPSWSSGRISSPWRCRRSA